MKNLKQIIVLAALVGLTQSAWATITLTGGTATTSGNQTMGVIPDGSASGRSSTVNLSGSTLTSITDVQVVLHGSGAFSGDLYAYLTHDDGFAVLLNRIGATAGNDHGYSAGYGDVRFNDASANDVHTYQTVSGSGVPLSGSWHTDARKINPNSAGSAFDDAASRTANFGTFNKTTTGNGNWTLFVADMSAGGANQVDSWDLEITGVPEPVDYALMAFGGIFAAVQGMRYMKRRKVAA